MFRKYLVPIMVMSVLTIGFPALVNAESTNKVLTPVPTVNAPPGVSIEVSTVGFIHVPHRKQALVNKPIPMQVVTTITNSSASPVSWSIKPESLHFWHLEDLKGGIIESSATMKSIEPGLSELTIELAPKQSIETRELITVGYDKLKPETVYRLKYTYWGLRNSSEFEAIDGVKLTKLTSKN